MREMADLPAPLSPGATIGILGSGQLGRMLAMAAARLGLKCHIYADESGPAFDVAADKTIAKYDDGAALAAFAARVDAITYEFENVPVTAVEIIGRIKPVRPGAKALEVAQDRLNEKRLARDLGAMTAEFAAVGTRADLEGSVRRIGLPAILKTRRMGYDGKGQIRIKPGDDLAAALAVIDGQPAILESVVPFEREISVVGVRGAGGAFSAYDPVENEHRHHILHRSTVPARIGDRAAAEAVTVTRKLAEALDYIGLIAVEFFVVGTGAAEALYVNEIAPRVHNSGHWTIDACTVSQFENHMRAVAGWPLGTTARHADAVMLNLIGPEALDWPALVARPGAAVHLYGKRDARPGRKMGHVTMISPRKIKD